LKRRLPSVKAALKQNPRLWELLRWMKWRLAPPLRGAPRFHALLRQRSGVKQFARVRDPLQRNYIGYALSTVRRGENAVEQMRRFAGISGKRYLDIGCAYGGFLVAFARAGAREVVGIDCDDHLLDYARALIEDFEVTGAILKLDLLDASAASVLGTFDLITCNDVIEHVANPRLALRQISSLHAPGGVLWLSTPNRFHPSWLCADPHFQIFGISALPKSKADRYLRSLTGRTNDVTYRSYGFYRRNLERLGLKQCGATAQPGDLGGALRQLAAQFEDCERRARYFEGPRTSDELVREARRRVLRLAALYRSKHEECDYLSRGNPRKADALADRLVRTFGADFWNFVVRRPDAGR
jgi:2-polyprenyl-3-methyl-5-hydroxy-6-metoxy-1,4-benzoquinol methylase